MITDTESQGYSATQYLSVISDKVLENVFKVTTRVFSWNSMNANREPKRIISDNIMLLQCDFMFNFQCHF